jgi:hypothetical protein
LPLGLGTAEKFGTGLATIEGSVFIFISKTYFWKYILGIFGDICSKGSKSLDRIRKKIMLISYITLS